MSRKFKRLLAVMLSVVMMFTSSMLVFAADTTSTEDAIIAQAVALDEKINLADYEFAVVTLEENSGARSIGASEKAIQTFDTTDGVTVATTILP